MTVRKSCQQMILQCVFFFFFFNIVAFFMCWGEKVNKYQGSDILTRNLLVSCFIMVSSS